jgi:BioD-like phosphotransacetylase family protein
MKAGEIKMRVSNTAIGLVDTYFNEDNLAEKFINSTLKIVIKQNLYKLDSLLALFTDENGDINVEEIITEYAQMIDETGFVFNLKDYIETDSVKRLIPDKALVIKREDIESILS